MALVYPLLDHDPQFIGRFRITRRLGEGGMGVVYAADDDALQREVAIKLLRTDAAARSTALLREARAAARVTHPSVCTIYEVGEHEGTPYLVMELLDGQSVAARLPTARWGRSMRAAFSSRRSRRSTRSTARGSSTSTSSRRTSSSPAVA